MSKEKKFRFWIPLDEIKKSVDGQGNTVMKLGGIASTKREDMDGEKLNPDGFDTTYLEEKGIINWNHSKLPEAVIGEPVRVEKRREGLYVESMLYPDNPLAKSVYELAETLRKNSKTRRLGYSIEGKATQRDLLDKSNVEKAKITNIALTVSPKNPDSIVDIIKGEFHDVEDDVLTKSIDEMQDEIVDLIKSEANGGKQTLLVDITRPDGTCIKVDKDYNVKIDKSLTTEPDSGKALIREDLGDQKLVLPCDEIKKGDLIGKIMDYSPVISFDEAFKISKNIIKMATKNKQKVTDDLLEKSLSALGISNKKVDDLQKSVDDDEDDDEDDEDDEMEKGEDGGDISDDEMYNDEEDNDEEEKKPAKKEAKKDMEKCNTGTKLQKSEVNVKALDRQLKQMSVRSIQSNKAIGTLLKATLDTLNNTNDKLEKSLDRISDLENELIKANEMIEELADQPVGRKSVTSARPVERTFNKGLGADELSGASADDGKKLSIRNKRAVLGLLDNMTFEKGFNDQLAKALTTFETSGNLSNGVIDLIKKEKGITITA